MNPLAVELNEILKGTVAETLLSRMGERMHFPKGIISQSAEADEKAYKYNATIGMACDKGAPLILDSIREGLPTLSAAEAVAYSSTGGNAGLRKRWRVELDSKNPSLRGKRTSVPVVVPGLTAAISFTADLFVDEGDEVVMPDMYWPNYRLVLVERKAAEGITFPSFAETPTGLGMNVEGLEDAMRASAGRAKSRCGKAKAACILNFPNNPTGYTPTLAEADRIVDALVRLASEGIAVLAIVDDAYFGLQYEDGVLRESIFARLADAHPNILAVKADGPTKEDYVWGFRIGFLHLRLCGLERGSARSPGQEALWRHPLLGVEFIDAGSEPFSQVPGRSSNQASKRSVFRTHPQAVCAREVLPRLGFRPVLPQGPAVQFRVFYELRLSGLLRRGTAEKAACREGHRPCVHPGPVSAGRFFERGRGWDRGFVPDHRRGRPRALFALSERGLTRNSARRLQTRKEQEGSCFEERQKNR
jgi:hypothetical protein